MQRALTPRVSWPALGAWARTSDAALPALFGLVILLGAAPVWSLILSAPVAALALRQRRWDHGVTLGALLIVAGSLLSIPFSIAPPITRLAIAGIVGAVAFNALLSRWWDRPRRLVGGLAVYCAIACLVVLVATIQVDIEFAKLNGWSQAVYAWFHHWPHLDNVGFSQNATAALIVSVCPFALALALSRGRWQLRLGAALAACWLLFALVLTLSRGAYLGLSLGLAVMLWLQGGKARWCAPLPPLLTLALLLLGVTGYEFTLSTTPTGWSSADRLYIWRTALRVLADFPLTGPGSGTFPVRVPAYTWPMELRDIPHAHNFVLQTYLDSGLLGLAGAALLLLGFAHGLRRLLARPLPSPLRALAIASAGALVGSLAHGSVDAYFWGDPRTFYVIGLPIAALLALCRLAGVSLAFPAVVAPPALAARWAQAFAVYRRQGRAARLGGAAALALVVALAGRPVLSLALTNSGNLARERAESMSVGAPLEPLGLAAAQLQLQLAAGIFGRNGVAWQDLAEVYIDEQDIPDAATALDRASAAGARDALIARDDRRLSQLAIAQASPSQRSFH